MIGKKSLAARIAMVGMVTVMLFLVLSTATYAWYSTNSWAEAGTLVFRSAVNNAGGDVTIGRERDPELSVITFDIPSVVMPMIPSRDYDPAVGMPYNDFVNSFQLAYEGLNEKGQLVVKTEPSPVAPLMLSLRGQRYFYIKNNSGHQVTLQVEYEITGNLADKLHIAYFMGTNPNNLMMQGIMSTTDRIHYGAIEKGEIVANKPIMSNARIESKQVTMYLGTGGRRCIALVAWLDGVDMKTINGGMATSFVVQFVGVEEE